MPSPSPLLPLAMLLHAPLAHAQAQHAVEVVVKEKGSGIPVSCLVEVDGEPMQTDDRGRLTLLLDEGRYDVKVVSYEHALWEGSLIVPIDSRRWEIFLLPQDADNVVTVVTQKDHPEPSHQVFSTEELMSVPGTFGDPLRAIQSLPGVARGSLTDANPVVRGSEGYMTGVWIDGMPVPFLFHWFLGRSVLNPTLLDEFHFLPGGLPAEYGLVSQGVLDARILRRVESPGFHGRASVDLMDGSISGRFQQGDWHTFVAGRYSWLGGIVWAATSAFSLGEFFLNPGYWDYTARTVGDLGDHEISITALGGGDDLRVGGEGTELSEFEEALPYDPRILMQRQFHRLQADWRYKAGWGRTQTAVSGGYTQELSLLNGLGFGVDGPQFGQISGFNLQMRHTATFRMNEAWTLHEGLDFTLDTVKSENYAELDTNGEPVTDHDVMSLVSPYVESRAAYPWGAVHIGLRGTWHHYQGGNHLVPEPRATVRWNVAEGASMNAFLGGYSQRPQAFQLSAAMGNPDLQPIRTWQTGVGGKVQLQPHLTLEGTAWATWFQNLTLRQEKLVVENRQAGEIDGGSSTGDPYAYGYLAPSYVDGDGMAVGGDFMLRLSPTPKWYGWISLTLQKAWRFEDDGWYPSDHDQPFGLNVVTAYQPGKGWQLSSRLQLTSGQPFTPRVGAYNYVPDAWQGIPQAINGARYPTFFQWDLRAEKTWLKDRQSITLYLDVMNVTAARNPIALFYDADFEEQITYVWLPVIPNLGVEVTY